MCRVIYHLLLFMQSSSLPDLTIRGCLVSGGGWEKGTWENSGGKSGPTRSPPPSMVSQSIPVPVFCEVTYNTLLGKAKKVFRAICDETSFRSYLYNPSIQYYYLFLIVLLKSEKISSFEFVKWKY